MLLGPIAECESADTRESIFDATEACYLRNGVAASVDERLQLNELAHAMVANSEAVVRQAFVPKA